MLAPLLLAADYVKALMELRPRGRAWSKDLGGVQAALMAGFAPTYERQTARANNLLIDNFPATTLELLPEWEASLGLPDPCAGEAPTIQARRAQVVARFASTGGQARAFYIAYAKQLGYDITISDYAPFRAGHSHAGEPVSGDAWFYAWAIHSQLNTVQYFRAGNSAAGEPLAYWSNTVLECEMQAAKPAHTILLFIYD